MRDELVEATTRILRRDGLAKLSTRAVAREAGVSEGALYKHFATKEELLLAAVDVLVAPYSAVASELPAKVGLEDVATLLSDVAVANYHFVLQAGPIWSSLHADPAFHRRYLELLRSRDMGPHNAMALLARYCAAEQRLGRLNPDMPAEAMADLVMAIAHFNASLDSGIGRDTADGPERVRRTLRAALVGLLPRNTGGPREEISTERESPAVVGPRSAKQGESPGLSTGGPREAIPTERESPAVVGPRSAKQGESPGLSTGGPREAIVKDPTL